MKKGLSHLFKKESNPENAGISKQEILSFVPQQEDLVIVEAGASDGTDTLEWSLLLPEAKIHAFEPIPDSYSVLKEKLKDRNNIYFYNLGLSDFSGEQIMYKSKNINNPEGVSSSSSILQPDKHLTYHPNILFEDQISIKAVTLYQWAMDNKIDHIDILWLDLQGAEYLVLSKSNILLDRIKIVYTEVSLMSMYKGSILYEDFKLWMNKMGFNVVKEDFRWKDMGNVLFVKR